MHNLIHELRNLSLSKTRRKWQKTKCNDDQDSKKQCTDETEQNDAFC
jgi:hypothetical protein